MPYTNINKSSDYFNTLLWTGNSGNQSITGNDFTADFTWSKTRSHAESHVLMDTVRDAGTTLNQSISSNTSNAEGTLNNSSTLTVNSTGFDLAGTSGGTLNYNAYTYATWLWRAGGHTGSSNTDGSISSTVSVNTTSGFSIITYTGNKISGATIGTGLGAVPKVIIGKRLDTTASWGIYHSALGATKYMAFDTSVSSTSTAPWNDTEPTSSVITLGNWDNVNASGGSHVIYAFAEKKGFSKFGSYTGNGNADGTFVYTGFKPAFVMIKKATGTGDGWYIIDNKRIGYNEANYASIVQDTSAEETGTNRINLLSNGFKCRQNNTAINNLDSTYIYMAFAEAPLVGSNNVPCTAR